MPTIVVALVVARCPSPLDHHVRIPRHLPCPRAPALSLPLPLPLPLLHLEPGPATFFFSRNCLRPQPSSCAHRPVSAYDRAYMYQEKGSAVPPPSFVGIHACRCTQCQNTKHDKQTNIGADEHTFGYNAALPRPTYVTDTVKYICHRHAYISHITDTHKDHILNCRCPNGPSPEGICRASA